MLLPFSFGYVSVVMAERIFIYAERKRWMLVAKSLLTSSRWNIPVSFNPFDHEYVFSLNANIVKEIKAAY